MEMIIAVVIVTVSRMSVFYISLHWLYRDINVTLLGMDLLTHNIVNS